MSYKKEAYLKNIDWMSNELIKIASDKNLSLTEELKQVRDLKQSYLDRKAAIEDEAAKGAPGSLFNMEAAPHVVEQLKSFVNAPYVSAQVSSLGGPEHVGVYFTISADPKETWVNGILQNSRYGNFSVQNDGTVEQFSGGFGKTFNDRLNFRKTNVKSVQQLIDVLNVFLAKVNATPAAPKTSSLKKASISVSVFNKEWSATPVTKKNKLSYEINDGKNIVLSISPLNGQEMTKEHLEWAIKRELTSGYKQAILKEDVAFLKKGTRVYILKEEF